MASVVKKKDWYYIKYYDLEGKQKWKAAKTKNRRVAKDLAKQLTEEINYQRKVQSETKTSPNYNLSVMVLLEEYKKYLQKRARHGNIIEKTVSNNFNYLKTFEAFLKKNGLSEKPARHLNKKVMQDYLDMLIRYKPESGGKDKLTAWGFKVRFEALNRFLRYIADEHTFNIEINPDITKIDMPKSEKPENMGPKTLTKEQVEYLICLPEKMKTTYAERDKMMLLVLFNTGMRSGELNDFKVKDIDFKDNVINVIGKGNKYRTVPLTEKLATDLKPFIAGKKTDEYVFVTNGQLSKFTLKVLFRRYEYELLKKYPEIEHIHPHLTRHTAISLMLESGIAVEVVKDIAGHSNIATTMIYTHVTKNRMKDEMKKFGI